MPQLTINITTAQAQRLAQALGHVRGLMDNTWVPATQQEVANWLLQQARDATLRYENAQAQQQDLTTRQAEQW